LLLVGLFEKEVFCAILEKKNIRNSKDREILCITITFRLMTLILLRDLFFAENYS